MEQYIVRKLREDMEKVLRELSDLKLLIKELKNDKTN